LTGARVIERTMASTGRLAVVRSRLAGARVCAAGVGRPFSRDNHAQVPRPRCVARRRRRLVASSGGDEDVVDVSGEDTAGTRDGSMGDGSEPRHPFEDSGEPRAASALLPGGDDFGAAAADASEDASLRSHPSLASADPAYGSAVGASPPSARITPFQNTVLNVGLASTAVLCALGVKRLVAFVSGIPDLPEEERLRRMAAFCDAQLARVRETREPPGSPGADFRDAELGRLTAMRADIEKKMEKFRDAELRRREWNRRLRRLDASGEPVGKKPGSHPGEPDGGEDVSELLTADAPRSETPFADTPPGRDADGFDAGGFGGGLRRARESRESRESREPPARARNRPAEEDALEKKAALPGASARWVKATDYLQSAVEKTAEGFSDMEGLAPDAPPPPPGAPRAAPAGDASARAGGSAARAETSGGGGDGGAGGGASSASRGRRGHETAPIRGDSSRDDSLDTRGGAPPREARKAPRDAKTDDRPAPTEPREPFGKKKKEGKKKVPPGKITHPDAVFDGGDDFRSAPGMTPARAEALAREIAQLEQMYGDDRSISAEALDEMCEKVIEKYGLADGKFAKDELYDPRDDLPKTKKRHVSEDDPFYWQRLKVVFPIFEANPATKATQIMTMRMTHPGLPAYLPGENGGPRVKPTPRAHAVCFQSRADAERFVWFMRSTRGADSNEGICTTQAMPPNLLMKTADAEGLGVTVIGEGRVDLSAGRADADVLGDMREIGGEQSLWEFAQWTRRELEEMRKPPPPTVSY